MCHDCDGYRSEDSDYSHLGSGRVANPQQVKQRSEVGDYESLAQTRCVQCGW